MKSSHYSSCEEKWRSFDFLARGRMWPEKAEGIWEGRNILTLNLPRFLYQQDIRLYILLCNVFRNVFIMMPLLGK